MTADELHVKYNPANLDQALEIAEAYIEEEGDLPEDVWHQLGFVQPTADEAIAVWDALTALRAAYFKELGQEMPAYQGGWI